MNRIEFSLENEFFHIYREGILVGLNFNHYELNFNQIKQIVFYICSHPSITELHLNSCKLDDEAVRLLAIIHPLKKLFLANNRITDEGAKAFAGSGIMHLDLSNNNISSEQMLALSLSPKVPSLKTLRLFYFLKQMLELSLSPKFPSLKTLCLFHFWKSGTTDAATGNQRNLPPELNIRNLPPELKNLPGLMS